MKSLILLHEELRHEKDKMDIRLYAGRGACSDRLWQYEKRSIIGVPVWWGDWPMIMYTFFEDNAEALAGKTLIPFDTNAGSGLSGFDTKLARALPASTVGEGLAIRGTDAQNDQDSVRETVNSWLAELGF